MLLGARLCLNMIVRDEARTIERCLRAARPVIDHWVICDTGSRDDTPAIIRRFFEREGLPGELHHFRFETFEQARNRALEAARASPGAFDYLLLQDADMELRLGGEGSGQLAAPAYLMQQRTPGLSYWSPRLLRRAAAARYRGVTHEYLEVEGCQRLAGAWFLDHADGGTRDEKLPRDIALLEARLAAQPDDVRALYYLAQSYKDAGHLEQAAELFARRVAAGGWPEEVWHARLQEARCRLALGDEAGFLAAALAAYELRPTRAEPLYELARFHRERAQYRTALLYALPALALRPPQEDLLFLEDEVYDFRRHEEVAIAGYYSADPAVRQLAHDNCEGMALKPSLPAEARDLARGNLRFYAPRLAALAPGWASAPVAAALPAGWQPLNPSIARAGEGLRMILRSVNYRLTASGSYDLPPGEGVRSRNWLLELAPDLSVTRCRALAGPAGLPDPGRHASGLEDLRLFAWQGELWCSGAYWNAEVDRISQALCRIDPDGAALVDLRLLREAPAQHEKNWMPLVEAGRLRFIRYAGSGEILDQAGRALGGAPAALALDHLRGGSQAIAFDGGWLAVTHEVARYAAPRSYLHRFVWFDAGLRLRRLSRAFTFAGDGVEFAAGLALHPDGRRLLVSYGRRDAEAWIGALELEALRSLLEIVAP